MPDSICIDPDYALQTLDTLRATRKLSPLEIEALIAPERRYAPEATLGDSDAAQRARARTEHLRVMDFKPLPRPGVLARLLALFAPTRFAH